jgi:uracil-DNA glycosylase
MASQEFLEELVEEAKRYVPGWLYAGLLRTARGRAGGKAKGRKAKEKAEQKACGDEERFKKQFEGPKNAPVCFVSASISTGDMIRQELMTGQAGSVFKDKYLKPLKLKKEDVLIVPIVAENVFKPSEEEISKHLDGLESILEERKPRIVVALGKQAAQALGDKCDFVMPHPNAVYRRGDSGEVGRKIKHLNKELNLNTWSKAEDLIEHLPESGKGEFVETEKGLIFGGDKGTWGLLENWPVHKQSEKLPKFGNLDKGTYELGIAKENNIEIFLDSSTKKGRYLITSTDSANPIRPIKIEKAKEDKPSIESTNLADVISKLRKANHKKLHWGKPGEHEVYDVSNGNVIKHKEILITKATPKEQIVYGVVIDPYGNKGKPEGDAHNDWMPPGDIQKTAHDYVLNSRVVGLQHSKKANAKIVESSIEQYPATEEYEKAMQGQAHKITRRKFGDDVLHSGAWVLGVKLGDAEWKLYEEGKINAFSPGGFGMRKPLVPSQMPDVQIIDLVEKPA